MSVWEREQITIPISEFMPEGFMTELNNLSLVTSAQKFGCKIFLHQ